jgi:ribonuclease BN (tRNA processing enzyme)
VSARFRRVLATFAAGVAFLAPPDAPAQAKPTTQVVMLGTGTPNADPDRSGPAVAVVVNGRAYLVDAGPGIVRRAVQAQRQGIAALAVEKLDIVFLTHLHSDHTVGLPDLLYTPWVLERTKPLDVYGPPGTRQMMGYLQAAFSEDVKVRIEGLEHANTTGHRATVHEVSAGIVYQDANVKVTAFAVPHASWRYAFGYRFETPDRTIVISGDARPSRAVVDACRGCDVLVHEVYSASRFPQRPKGWQRYHASAHTSTRELADLVRQAKPGLLVLYHQLYWGATDEDLLREVRARWKGRVVSAKDLGVY